jgi:putative ATP-dependent endonuclease of the OLD family
MHGLSHIYIENFRACRQVSLTLGGFTPLVGQNNVGKSTILEAIKVVVSPKAFVKTDAADVAQPIAVAACIEGITNEVLALIPEPRHRTAMQPYCVGGKLWIRVVGVGGAKLKQEVWQPEGHAGDGVPQAWRSYPTGLPEAVSALLPEALHIIAMDDVSEDLGKAKAGSTIRGLLDEIMTPILEAHAEVAQALEAVRNILGAGREQRSPLLRTFDNSATAALGEFFPGLTLDMDVPAIDVKEFFKSGDLHVTDDTSGDRRRFDQVGSGAQRAIQMALIRFLADMRHGAPQGVARRLLLIDEPELYLHPQGVRRLREALRSLSNAGFQVVFSTHSPLMLSRENAPDTVIVRRDANGAAVVRAPLRDAVANAMDDAQAQARTLFQLGNIADIYFSEKVIVCEGKTDQRLLPLIYEKLYGTKPELDRICFVEVGSCSSIPKGMQVLSAMGITCGAIADLDFAFTHARKGANAWLSKDADDMAQARAVLATLRDAHGLPLGGNGLPIDQEGVKAADTWARFAAAAAGAPIARAAHDALRDHHVWAWPMGSIEDVLGVDDKGEDAILAQEDRLRDLDRAAIEQQMPAFKSCLDWMRGL